MPKIALNPKSKLRHVSLIFLGSLVLLSYIVAFFFKTTHASPKAPILLPKAQKVSSSHIHGSSRFSTGLSPKNTPVEFVEIASAQEMCQAFEECGFELTKVASGEGEVPRIYLAKLPGDIKGLPPKHKRDAFIKSILPLILQVNEDIRQDREKLLVLQARLDKGLHLRAPDRAWLSHLATQYSTKSHDVKVLLKHVDEIPPSLALSQAILESGWGTSKAAKSKNSTFGHMATKSEVQAFQSLYANVKAYAKNLNTHAAYKTFREERAKMRLASGELNGHHLAPKLIKYSVRGSAYTQELQGLIKQLDLHHFDAAHIRLKP